MKTKRIFADCVGNRIARARQAPLVGAINAFMSSPKGIMLVALLTLLSHICSLEIVLYILTLLYCIYVCVLGDDFLTLAPLCVFCYIAPSRANNPGQNNASLFSGGTGIFLMVGVALFLICFLLRVGLDPAIGFKRLVKCKRKLLWGMLALGGAYAFSGIFSAHYGEIWLKNIAFGLLEFVTVFALYFLFTALIDWERRHVDYLMWVGFLAGCVIALEVFCLYIGHFDDFFLDLAENDRWNRWQIYLGWGMHNNIGAMLAMTSPFAFYLAGRYKFGYLFILPAVGMMAALFMTLSRTSILVGLIVFAISFVIMLFRAPYRKILLIAVGGLLVVGVGLLAVFWDTLLGVAADVFDNGIFDSSGRSTIYMSGLKAFAYNPVFGEGFYPSDMSTFETAYWLIGSDMTAFLPPRWHNTVVQLLASCGIVGLLAYAIHRIQTILLFLYDFSLEKLFIALALVAFLGMSLLDNHFFNLGPTLFYSMALAFAEKSGEPKKRGVLAPEKACDPALET